MIVRVLVTLIIVLGGITAARSVELAPAISLQESVQIASDYVAREKWDTSSQFLASAQLIRAANGPGYWEITWKPRDRFTKGGFFSVRVAMDKSITVIHGK
jgi:hypothetical protein